MTEQNMIPLYLLELFSGLARGSFIVCIAWTGLMVSDDVAFVGQIFTLGMVANLVAGFLMGVIVDRYNRKNLVIAAHVFIASILIGFGIALNLSNDIPLLWFFLTVIFVNINRMLYQLSHDGLIHVNVDKEHRPTAIARFRGVHLLATAAGTIIVGIVIDHTSQATGFMFSGLTSVALIMVVVFVKGVTTKSNVSGPLGFLNDLSAGFALFRDNRVLRDLTLLVAVATPIGQLVNALLTALVRDDLGLGSDIYGVIDSGWQIGGMLAAGALAFGITRATTAPNTIYILSFLVGVATVAFSFVSNVYILLLLHIAMGLCVWMCRIIVDGRVLQMCSAETVGRSKVYIDMMFFGVAVIMCLSPTFIELPSPSSYFLYWGLYIVVGTGVVWLLQFKGSRLERDLLTRPAVDRAVVGRD